MLAIQSPPPTASSFRTELMTPVRYAGQEALKPQADYIVSTHQHYVGILCDEVEKMQSLLDGWDGYGGVAPSSSATENVINILTRLPVSWAMRLKQVDMTPTPYGTITLEWQPGRTEYIGIEVGDATWALFGQVGGRILNGPVEFYSVDSSIQALEAALQELYPGVTSLPLPICAYTC
jgi:hypothetical protein